MIKFRNKIIKKVSCPASQNKDWSTAVS